MGRPPFSPPVPRPLHGPKWANEGRDRPAGNLDFRVTQTFDHVNEEISPLPHKALDLGNTRLGAPVTAPAPGVVVAEGWLTEPWSQTASAAQLQSWSSPPGTGYGGVMCVIRHNDEWTSAFAHLDRTIVNAGQHVKRGQIIGYLGQTGAAHGQGHLHWDVYHNVRPEMTLGEARNHLVDPWPLLRQNYRKVRRDLDRAHADLGAFNLASARKHITEARRRLVATIRSIG